MRRVILFISILTFIKGISQNNLIPFNISSPQSMEFQRYGNIPVNLSVGAIDFNIPIFNHNRFNIALQYNSSGFIPMKKSNYVGYNWFLNLGGSIIRETKDIDDDFNGTGDNSGNFLIKGFLFFIKNKNEHQRNLESLNLEHYLNVKGYYTELNSDKYHFNFMGIQGYFYIDSDGKAIAVSNDTNLKIDISKMSYQNNKFCKPDYTEIKIVDGKGNQYYFGGEYENLEVAYNMGDFNNIAYLTSGNLYSVRGWYLRRIIYNEGVEINIYNKRFDDWFEHDFCNTRNIIPNIKNQVYYDLNFPIVQNIFKGNYDFNFSAGGWRIRGNGSGWSWTSPYQQINIVKKVFPNEVVIDKKIKLKFNYITEKSAYRGEYDRMMLKSIETLYDDIIVNNQLFEYHRDKDYFFLKELRNNDESYLFEYYHDRDLPISSTFGIDHWGYWNGKDARNNALIPKYRYNIDTGEYNILGDERSPSLSLFNASLLKKVVYPTGGKTTFEYEPHYYSKKVDRIPKSNFLKTIVGENGNVGGARIKRIRDFDEYDNMVERTYQYVKQDNSSSGILLDVMRYIFVDDYKNIGKGRTHNVFESNRNYSASSLSNSPIEYGRVLEYKNGILYKENIFSTYETHPDSLSYAFLDNKSHLDFRPKNMNRNLQLEYEDFGDRRRKPLQEIYYKDTGKKVKEINYLYKYLQKEKNNKKGMTISVSPTIYGTFYYKKNYHHTLLGEREEIDYFGNHNIVNTQTYEYDMKNLNKISENLLMKDSEQTQRYYYANDKKNQFLIDKNVVGVPLEIIIEQDMNILSKTETKYPISKIEANTQTNDLALPISVINYDIGDITQSSESIAYTKYDNKGNLLEYKENGIKPVSIIWGYDQTLPIAKIEGANYTEVEKFAQDIIRASDKDKDEVSERELLLLLDEFRKYPEFSKYQITTYTHNPLIGITSITPSTGIRVVYKYDENNRLERILDLKGNIIREYKYNYSKNKTYYNSEHRQNFKSEICGLDANAEIYTYIVPEGQYSSIISQEDAEQKALDDIAKNGQKEANQKGKCTKQCSFKYIENSYYPYKPRIEPIIIEKDNKVGLNIPVIPGGDYLQGWGDEIVIGKIEGTCISKSIEIQVPMKGSHTKKDWRWIVRIKEDGILSLQIEDYYNIFDSYSRKLFHNKLGENKMLTVTIILNLD